MSAILLITLQKDAQQIDLTQENWFPDLVFISFENLHIWPTDLWRKKPAAKKKSQATWILVIKYWGLWDGLEADRKVEIKA